MAVGHAPLPSFHVIEGLRLGIAEAGIKKSKRKDLVIIEVAKGGCCVGVFTKNAFCAAPVQVCKQHLENNGFCQENRYLLINTGNANAGTGAQGMQDALASCNALAELEHVSLSSVLPFSTGVIGEKLPVDKIVAGLPAAIADLSEDNWSRAAEGIMTTDTRPKGATRRVLIDGKAVHISGISKGAGMIKPNMATMLAFVGTDARIAPELAQSLLREAVNLSFNRITIDSDTSTNDACMFLATAHSSAPEITEDHPDYDAFKSALSSLMQELAHLIVKDGEGATKFIEVAVESAQSSEEALEVAYTIAHSPLVKTAFYASDPNWGRILAAVGRAGLESLDLGKINIYLDEVCIVSAGERDASYTEEQGQRVMDRDTILVRVELGRGTANERVWTSDLSHDYVTINAEYRT
ncbi:MAG: bifunctional glutamate N-acetyltransferase/amino-acid acetyltransferase ArgJ [Oleiphilaceae bacterium]|nr:bifunctional glutamate N-acetyltransferase/amino-acid acetyltransferase ArgJ [Oleiphilaceae bacterium]